MGEVYLAEHEMLKRPCAIKLIRHELAGNPRIFARFEREVRATAQLSHWNTIEIFDYGRNDDGAFYYVMEYLPGPEPGRLVERYGPDAAGAGDLPAPPGLRRACTRRTTSGLIHRDIKPANLMAAYRGGLSRRGQAARLRPGQDLERGRLDPSLAGGNRRRLALVHGPRASHAQTSRPTAARTFMDWGPSPTSC